MRRFVASILSVLLLGLAFGAAILWAKDQPAKYKNIEVTHFKVADGVTLPDGFTDGFYTYLREQLTKQKAADQVVADGATVPDADAADSIVLEGTFTSYKPAGRTMLSLGNLGWEINAYRKSDHSLIVTDNKGTATRPGWKEDQLEEGTAFYAAYDIKKDLK
jgi:hypothetical protein